MPETLTAVDKSVYLFKTEGSSDKEYHAHLRQRADGWGVDYANGPRGKVGQSKPKTPAPLNYSDALTVFDKLVSSKKKDGYTEDSAGVRFTNTEEGKNFSGHIQQLPTAIDQARAAELERDDGFAAQEKANGERRTIEVVDGQVRGINKLGLYVNIPETWVTEFSKFGNAKIDGEQVGETFHAFDMVSLNSIDLGARTFATRYDNLVTLFMKFNSQAPSLQLLKAAFTTAEKAALLAVIKAQNREGLVYKEISAPYTGGRSDSVFKYKLLESCTCLVVAQNQQNSVQLGLHDSGGYLVPVGNVTIPANQALPSPGSLLEVQYLYFNPGGAFEQPISLGLRNDILPEETVLTQIKRLKPGVTMDADGRRTDQAVPNGPKPTPARPRP